MTMVAMAAMMMASQFTFSSNARLLPCGGTLEERHEHSYPFRVGLVLGAETLAEQALFDTRPHHEGRDRAEQGPGDEEQVAGREARPEEVDDEARIDGMPRPSERPVAHELVIGVDLEDEVVVAAERGDGPEGECDARNGEAEPDPAECGGYVRLLTHSRDGHDVRRPEEVRGDRREATTRDAHDRAAPRDGARARDLREHDERRAGEHDDRGDELARHASASRSRIADSAFAPSSSWRK